MKPVPRPAGQGLVLLAVEAKQEGQESAAQGTKRTIILEEGKAGEVRNRLQQLIEQAERTRKSGPAERDSNDAKAEAQKRLQQALQQLERAQKGEPRGPQHQQHGMPGQPAPGGMGGFGGGPMPHGHPQPPLPADMEVTIKKRGNEPARIRVKQGDKLWATTEKEMEMLPAEARHYALVALGHHHPHPFGPHPGTPGAPGNPGQRAQLQLKLGEGGVIQGIQGKGGEGGIFTIPGGIKVEIHGEGKEEQKPGWKILPSRKEPTKDEIRKLEPRKTEPEARERQERQQHELREIEKRIEQLKHEAEKLRKAVSERD